MGADVMASPIPTGWVLDSPPFDPLGAVQDWGVQLTSGKRTPEHNRAVGGVPNSYHLSGDALDLIPGESGWTMGRLHAEASNLARQWPGAKVLNEGDHVHVQLPGWGGAPSQVGALAQHGDIPSGWVIDQPARPAPMQ